MSTQNQCETNSGVGNTNAKNSSKFFSTIFPNVLTVLIIGSTIVSGQVTPNSIQCEFKPTGNMSYSGPVDASGNNFYY